MDETAPAPRCRQARQRIEQELVASFGIESDDEVD